MIFFFHFLKKYGFDEEVVKEIISGENTKLLRRDKITEEEFWKRAKEKAKNKNADLDLIK